MKRNDMPITIIKEILMKTCSNCGDEFDGDVCPMCNTPVENVTDQTPPTEKQAAVNDGAATAEINPFAERLPKKVGSFVKKAKAFDTNKHGLIGTIVTLVFAVVFILLALCVPIKVQGIGLGAIYDSAESNSEKVEKVVVSYVDVDQSILRFYECAINFNYSPANKLQEKKTEKLLKEYIYAQEAAEREFKQWLLSKGENVTAAEISEKKKQILADKLGETNYNMLMVAAYTPIYANDTLVSGDHEIQRTTRYTIIGGLLIAIILSGIAITSLVIAIMSLVGLSSKKNKNYLFKMLTAICVCSIVAVGISAICPGLALGGAALAIAITSAVTYFVLGVGYAALFGKVGGAVILKKSIVAALLCVTMFLMLTNIISGTVTSYRVAVITNGNYSSLGEPVLSSITTTYGGVGIIDTIMPSIHSLELRGIHAVYSHYGDADQAIFLFFVVALVMLLVAYNMVLYRLVYGEKALTGKKKLRSIRPMMIVALCFAIAVCIVTLCFGGTLDSAISGLHAQQDVQYYTALVVDVAVCVQFYVAVALLAIALVFEFAFRPKKKAEKSAQQLNAKQ